MHTFTVSGGYDVSLTVTDADHTTSSVTRTIVVNEAPTELVVFADSFEAGLGNWTQDQYDWFTRDRRATDGTLSAEVDGNADDAELVSPEIDLAGKPKAILTFSWYIESGLDSGEYLALDISVDGGPWQEHASLNGNVDQESTMHDVQIEITGATSLTLRFRARMSSGGEDANLDNVVVTATSAL